MCVEIKSNLRLQLLEGEEDPRLKEVALRKLENPAEGAELTVDDLKHMQSTHFQEMMATVLLPLGERRIYCFGINVHPAFQGRGVGSELVKWVTRKADEDDVKVWIHASEAAYELVRKHSFQLIEELVLDLDKYSTKVSDIIPQALLPIDKSPIAKTC